MTGPHTKEPWRLSEGQPDNIEGVFVEGCLRDSWCRDPVCSEEDAARIVACVNACAGMEDPAVEIAKMRAALEHIAHFWKGFRPGEIAREALPAKETRRG